MKAKTFVTIALAVFAAFVLTVWVMGFIVVPNTADRTQQLIAKVDNQPAAPAQKPQENLTVLPAPEPIAVVVNRTSPSPSANTTASAAEQPADNTTAPTIVTPAPVQQPVVNTTPAVVTYTPPPRRTRAS